MKVFNIAFVFIFIVFAGLQYNDPDPYVWMPIYLYAAAFCWLSFRHQFYPKAYIFGSLVCAGYAVYKAFDENGLVDWITKHHAQNIAGTMKAEKPWIEETREFFGLLIVIAVLMINYFYSKRKMRKIAATAR